MIIARPSVEQERWLALADRYPALRVAVDQSGGAGSWKTTTKWGRVLGFLLGLLGTGLLGGVLSPLPSPMLVGGLVLVVVAEWLVAKRRVFRSGIEEAVYLCGTVAVVVQFIIWSDGDNAALGVAMVAVAVLLAGWRLLNPLFTTLAVAALSLAIALVGAGLFDSRLNMREACVFCVVVALVAVLAGRRIWQRPAHDAMLDGLVIVMPWLGFGWLVAYGWRGDRMLAWGALVLALFFLVLLLAVGLRRRRHAPLAGALGNLACAGFAVHELLRWPHYLELIAAGAGLLVVAVIVERRLRNRCEGLTSDVVEEADDESLLPLAGAAHLAPAGVAPQPAVQGGGGEFGGGGASGRF